MSVIAFIPVRIGSKSISEKNIKSFCGKPLIFWSLKALQDSNIDLIIVATDSNKIKEIVNSKYEKGFKIGCFTASSKGNTLLNSLHLNKKIIKFASENNSKKIGKFTPGSHIKIISDENFYKKKIDYAILLSWNYKNFFISKSEFKKKGGKFIIPLPKPHIE